MNKEGGWERFSQLTSNNKRLDSIVQDDNFDDPDQIQTAIEKEERKIKFAAFGKIGIKSRARVSEKVVRLQKKKMTLTENVETEKKEIADIEEEMKEAILNDQRETLKMEMDKFETCIKKKGSAAAIFKLRERVLGGKKKPQEAIIIKDPDTNIPITDRNEILKTTLKYCKNLLMKKEPIAIFKEDYKSKVIAHQRRMKEECEEVEFTESMIQKALNETSKKKPGQYDFIIKSGNSYEMLFLSFSRKCGRRK